MRVEYVKEARYDLAKLPRHRNLRADDMKLDMDLLRSLLIHVEEKALTPHSNLDAISILPWNDDQITYHVIRAEEAKLINAYIDHIPDDEDPEIVHVVYSVHGLTFSGHELLGAIREEGVWKNVKGGVKQVGAVTVDVIVGVAKAYLKKKVKEVTGLDVG